MEHDGDVGLGLFGGLGGRRRRLGGPSRRAHRHDAAPAAWLLVRQVLRCGTARRRFGPRRWTGPHLPSASRSVQRLNLPSSVGDRCTSLRSWPSDGSHPSGSACAFHSRRGSADKYLGGAMAAPPPREREPYFPLLAPTPVGSSGHGLAQTARPPRAMASWSTVSFSAKPTSSSSSRVNASAVRGLRPRRSCAAASELIWPVSSASATAGITLSLLARRRSLPAVDFDWPSRSATHADANVAPSSGKLTVPVMVRGAGPDRSRQRQRARCACSPAGLPGSIGRCMAQPSG